MLHVCCPCLFGSSSNADTTDFTQISNLTKWGPHRGKGVKAGNFAIQGTGSILANAPLLQTRAYFEFKVREGAWKVQGSTSSSESSPTSLPPPQAAAAEESHDTATTATTDKKDTDTADAPPLSKAQKKKARKRAKKAAKAAAAASEAASIAAIVPLGPTFCVGVAQKSASGLDGPLVQRGATTHAREFGTSAQPIARGDVVGVSFDLSGVKAVLTFYVNGEERGAPMTGIRGEMYPAASVTPGVTLDANFGQRSFEYAPPPNFDGVIYCRDLI